MKNSSGASIKTVCNIILGIMLVCSIVAIALCINYWKNPPNTQKTLYTNALTFAEENSQGEKPYPIEINVFTNERETGIYCTDIKFNYYTDTTIPTTDEDYKFVYSSGIQILDDFRQYIKNDDYLFLWSIHKSIVFEHARYYNTVYGQSYSAINELSPTDNWIVDYSIKTTDELGNEKITHNLAKLFQRGATYDSRGFLMFKNYLVYDINRAISDLTDIVSKLDNGTYILPFDMSDYFSYNIYNAETAKFEPVTADELDCFVTVKITKTDNGLVRASQSLFGQIDYKTDYAYDNVNAEDYAEARVGYVLTEADFVLLGGELYLKPQAKNYLVNFAKMNIQVVLNLDKLGITKGFSKNIFKGLDIFEITILSTEPQEFYIYEDYNILTYDITIIHKGGTT